MEEAGVEGEAIKFPKAVRVRYFKRGEGWRGGIIGQPLKIYVIIDC